MLTLGEYSVGKVWADTDGPIIFLKPAPLTSGNSLDQLFRIVHDMGRSIHSRTRSRLYLLVDLTDCSGSDPALVVYYLRSQLRLRTTASPDALAIVASTDMQVMHAIHAEIPKIRSGKASVHASFEDALRQISQFITSDALGRRESWLERVAMSIRRLF